MVKTKIAVTVPTVTVEPNGLIIATYKGDQSTHNSRYLADELKKAIDNERSVGKPVRILLVMNSLRLSRSTSGSRAIFKEMAQYDYDNAAIVGNRSWLQLFNYIARSSGRGQRLHFFVTEKSAKHWLKQIDQPKLKRETYSLIVGLVVLIAALSNLYGWLISNHRAIALVNNLRPMNPLLSISLIVIAAGYFGHYLVKPIRFSFYGVIIILIGVVGLLYPQTEPLFKNSVNYYGHFGHTPVLAWLCLISIGIAPFINSLKNKIKSIIVVTLGGLLSIIGLLTIYGSLYDKANFYNLSAWLVLPLGFAIAILMVGSAFLLSQTKDESSRFLDQTSRFGWLVAVGIIVLQIAIYNIWIQSTQRNQHEVRQNFNQASQNISQNLSGRVQAYTDALYGFKGLFTSSSYVSAKEFDSYDHSLNLNSVFPGLRAISFIRVVSTSQIQALLKDQHTNNDPNFKIQGLTKQNTHYILSYVTNTTKTPTTIGSDFSSNPVRVKTYLQALNTDMPSASGKIVYSPTAGSKSPNNGFFITIPVNYENSTTNIGLVSAVFYYNDFFKNTFDNQALQDLDLNISDNQNQSTLFNSQQINTSKTSLAASFSIAVANDKWNVNVKAPANYGITSAQTRLPSTLLFVGQIVSLLLLVIFLLMNNGRRQALQLADAITEDLQKERQALLTVSTKDEAMLNGIGEGLIVFNAGGHAERVNAAALKLLGYSEDEVMGQHYVNVLKAVDVKGNSIAPSKRPLAHALATGKSSTNNIKMSYTRKDGSVFPVQFNIAPIFLAGKQIGVIEIFRDIAKEQALDKAKDEFVSLASHQLRTPLTASRLFLEMLLDGQVGKLNPQQRDYIDKVQTSTHRMIALVGDFLNSSRADMGRLKVEPQPTDIGQLIASHVDEQKLVAEQKGIHLNFKAHKLPLVDLDQNLYGQVVHNLLTNAIRYTPANGKVEIKLNLNDEGYQLSVSDNGIGIPVTAQTKLFERFYRAENAVRVEGEGSGLGLYLIKKIVSITGGTISFDSIENKGTTFYVTIPKTGMKAKKGEVRIN